MHIPDYFTILSLVLFACTVRVVFGFGDGLIIMPILSMLYGLKFASPFVAIMSIIVGILLSWKNFKYAKFNNIWILLLSSTIGVALGVFLLKAVPETYLKIALGVILIAFPFFRKINIEINPKINEKFASIYGIFSGMLGGAYNSSGPPLIIYGIIQKWDAKEFRSNLQLIFAISNIYIIGAHYFYGNITPQILQMSAYCLPPILASIYLGEWIFNKIEADKFSSYVNKLIQILGLAMIAKVVFG